MSSTSRRVAVITGASRGIGREIARRLARDGFDLALLARASLDLQAASKELTALGCTALSIPTDLRVPEQIAQAITLALERFGHVDVLVNNAGLWRYAPVETLDLEVWNEMFDVNVRSAFVATKHTLPSMLRRKRGHIINIGSVSGLIGEEGATGYGATKWALRGFSQCLLKEVRDKGVRVTLVNPGATNNEGATTAEAARRLQNEDVAKVVAMAIDLPPSAELSEVTLWSRAEKTESIP